MITKSQLPSPPTPISAVRRQRRRAPLPRADPPRGISATLIAWLVAHGRSPMDLPPLSHQALFAAVRSADADAVRGLLAGAMASGSTTALAAAQTDAGESALYVAAEADALEVVCLLLPLYDLEAATLRSRLDLDAFHVAAKQGHTEVVKEFLGRWPELCSVCDSSNACPMYSAAVKDHLDVVNAILDTDDNCIKIVRKNGKTSLHTAARIGFHRIVKALIERDPGIVAIRDRKGQPALHMAVKGKNTYVVEELLMADVSILNVRDKKANTALHIATRKWRPQVPSKFSRSAGSAAVVVDLQIRPLLPVPPLI